MRSCRTTLSSSYALSWLSTMGEVNTHGDVGTPVWAGQPQLSLLGVQLPWLWALGSSTPLECSTLVNTRSPNKPHHCCSCDCSAWQWCPRSHCDSATWVSARSSCSFAVLCLWSECRCLSVVLETVYKNYTNKVFTRNGPLNRTI